MGAGATPGCRRPLRLIYATARTAIRGEASVDHSSLWMAASRRRYTSGPRGRSRAKPPGPPEDARPLAIQTVRCSCDEERPVRKEEDMR
jgi:hypothetical protein